MATEPQNYLNEQAMKAAILRDGNRHKTGWKVKNIIRNNNKTWTINWTNDTPVVISRRKLTTPQLLREVANLLGIDLI